MKDPDNSPHGLHGHLPLCGTLSTSPAGTSDPGSGRHKRFRVFLQFSRGKWRVLLAPGKLS